MVLGWSVSGTQNTHRHPLWCWMHSNFDPNEVLHEVHLKFKIFQIAKTSFYDARQSIDCRVGWPLREAVSRSFHYICTFSSWKWYDHWFFKRTTQFFTFFSQSLATIWLFMAILNVLFFNFSPTVNNNELSLSKSQAPALPAKLPAGRWRSATIPKIFTNFTSLLKLQ